MSTDTFEGELRSLLHDTADAEGPSYVDVDPNAVVTQGRRVIRRRRMAAGAGIAAAVVALGTVGIATLGDGVDRTSDPAVSTSVPTATGPVSVELSPTLDGLKAPLADDPASAQVEVDEKTLTWTVTLTSRSGRRTTRPAATLPANPRFSTYAEVGNGSGLIVGVMPAAAKDIAPVWLTDSVESSFARAPLPGTDRQAFAVRYSAAPDPNVPGETMFAGFDWTDGTSVYSGPGAKVPSMTYSGAIGFMDPQQQVVGVYVDGQMYTSDIGRSDIVPSMSVVAPPEPATTLPVTVFAVLPAGATAIEVRAEGAEDQSKTLDLGAAVGTGVLVRAAPAFDPTTTGVTITWTNVDGSPGSLDADARR